MSLHYLLQNLLSQAEQGIQITSVDLAHKHLEHEDILSLIELIKNQPKITKIDLAYNNLTDAEGVAIVEAAKQLKSLDSLDFNSNNLGVKSYFALASLLDCSPLTSLVLDSNEINRCGPKCSKFKQIHKDALISIFTALKNNQHLKLLSMDFNGIGDEEVVVLANSLKDNSILSSLYLGSNLISDVGLNSLSIALETNNSLNELSLSLNRIGLGQGGNEDLGSKTLIAALQENSSLTKIDLSGNLIDRQLLATILDITSPSYIVAKNIAKQIIAAHQLSDNVIDFSFPLHVGVELHHQLVHKILENKLGLVLTDQLFAQIKTDWQTNWLYKAGITDDNYLGALPQDITQHVLAEMLNPSDIYYVGEVDNAEINL